MDLGIGVESLMNPNDWVVYDNLNHSTYPETECE